MSGTEGIIVGAFGALFAAAFLHRLFFVPSPESRVRVPGVPGRVQGLPTRVQGRAHWLSALIESRAVAGRETMAGVHGPSPGPPLRTVGMGTGDQVREFVRWLVTEEQEGHAGKWSDDGVWRLYRRWAAGASIMHEVPRSILLKKLAEHPQVRRKRELVLDKNGNAIWHPSGKSKLRDTYYTIKPPRAQPVLPGKVPVAEIVEARPVLTKAQRATARAATEQPEQPLRRAA